MNKSISMKALTTASLLLLAVGGFEQRALAADDTYRLTELRDLTHRRLTGVTIGSHLNNVSEVIGSATRDAGPSGGTLWHHFFSTELGDATGQPIGAVHGINDRSEVVGTLEEDGVFTPYILRRQVVERIDVGPYGWARALNNRNEVALDHYASPNGTGGVVYWFNGVTRQVQGTGISDWASAINNAGAICGASGNIIVAPSREPNVAWVWANNVRTVIPPLPGDSGNGAEDINDHNEVVGQSRQGNSKTRGFLWRNGVNTDLQMTLTGDANSAPWAINDSTLIVGWSGPNPFSQFGVSKAVIWRNGATRDLNSLIAADDPLKPYVRLYSAIDINDAGEIIAQGVDSRASGEHAYFLRPTRLPNVNP